MTDKQHSLFSMTDDQQQRYDAALHEFRANGEKPPAPPPVPSDQLQLAPEPGPGPGPGPGPESASASAPSSMVASSVSTIVTAAAPPRRQVMHPTALVFLEDPIARKLAVAWTACGGDEAHWLDAAGLSDNLEARRACKALRANGICQDGGITDEKALVYIQAIATEPLKKLRERQQQDQKGANRR